MLAERHLENKQKRATPIPRDRDPDKKRNSSVPAQQVIRVNQVGKYDRIKNERHKREKPRVSEDKKNNREE